MLSDSDPSKYMRGYGMGIKRPEVKLDGEKEQEIFIKVIAVNT